MGKAIQKIFIANRGEIALRIQRACKALGLSSVSVSSEVDRESLHAREAETLVVVEGAAPLEAYLHPERLVEAAVSFGCDAVHPGYGFLSENAEFSALVQEAGLTFIGPPPKVIQLMGDKLQAKRIMKRAGVPCLPGTEKPVEANSALKKAKQIGFPLIVKAAAGGGGRGMRLVQSEAELEGVLHATAAEAKKSFGDGRVYLERFVSEPRHVEVQILSDSHGNHVHLGTRDCSTQRRHQKLIEEAPAPFLSRKLEKKITSAAVKAAKAVRYLGAGTVEFLLEGEEFYFLEMNTRIQVEHPVTEVVTGIDLVEQQIEIAQGKKLSFSQREAACCGHAIEFRLYAEDPEAGFLPATGRLSKLSVPSYEWFRFDTAVEAGDEISPYYDAMLAKLIVSGASRDEALLRSRRLLSEIELSGFATSLPLYRWLLCCSPFPMKPLSTRFLDSSFEGSNLQDPLLFDYSDQEQSVLVRTVFRENDKGKPYLIDLFHRPDHLYLAVPRSEEGELYSRSRWRLSNDPETALSSVDAVDGAG